jgi:predicted RNase H-like HicB family nuclease
MHRFLVVFEKANGNYSAYCPDLAGCATTGKTRDQVTRNMHAAIKKRVRACGKMRCLYQDLIRLGIYYCYVA